MSELAALAVQCRREEVCQQLISLITPPCAAALQVEEVSAKLDGLTTFVAAAGSMAARMQAAEEQQKEQVSWCVDAVVPYGGLHWVDVAAMCFDVAAMCYEGGKHVKHLINTWLTPLCASEVC
jgi:hypothetical protein